MEILYQIIQTLFKMHLNTLSFRKTQPRLRAILVVFAFLFLFFLFQKTGLVEKISPKNFKITLGIAFLTGIVASFSTCLALIGSVVIAFNEKYAEGSQNFYQTSLRPNLLFHFGRLGTFFLLGGLLGIIGKQININNNFTGFLTIAVSAIMIWLSLNILGFLPSISVIGIRMPSAFAKYWLKLEKSKNGVMPLALGGLTFFLPCGFTQSMQIFALASGSFLMGGASMLLFASGTLPTLFLMGITAAQTKKMPSFQKAAGILILLFAFLNIKSGLVLINIKTSIFHEFTVSSQNATKNNEPSANENKQAQEIEMHVTSWGFQPNVFKIKKDTPVKWIIKGDRITGCTEKIIVPGLNIAKTLNSGDNIIMFTPSQPGEIPFSCAMGMVRGKFVVES